jgi:hypothetical protein
VEIVLPQTVTRGDPFSLRKIIGKGDRSFGGCWSGRSFFRRSWAGEIILLEDVGREDRSSGACSPETKNQPTDRAISIDIAFLSSL